MEARTLRIEGGLLAAPEAMSSGVTSFKGVPYATPPVGALRWRPPRPPAPWPGVRTAHSFGPNAMQGIVFDDIDPLPAGISEDCLYLNIWTPATGTAERLPVMVWIHGGGFAVGSGAEPRYDGANLAARGIVVVTLNHRLNVFGFLAHPELSAESTHGASGNYGVLDLVAALEWVSRNIAAFGGDPGQVTIAGESAGSMAVSALMASPHARGLFARAIGQSGALFASPGRRLGTLAEAEQAGLAFAEHVGASSLASMRAMSAEKILAAAPGLGFWPIVDGHFLPRSPAEIFAAGEQNDVPLLAGWNKDEGFNFSVMNADGASKPFVEIVRSIFGDRTEDALAFYPAGSPEVEKQSARALGGDLAIIHGAWDWLEAQKKTGGSDIFRFRFERAPRTPDGWFGGKPSAEAGAFHAGELPYVFGTLDAFPWLITQADRDIAEMTSRYWANFVKTGDPNSAGLPVWLSSRKGDGQFLAIDLFAENRHDSIEERARREFLTACAAL